MTALNPGWVAPTVRPCLINLSGTGILMITSVFKRFQTSFTRLLGGPGAARTASRAARGKRRVLDAVELLEERSLLAAAFLAPAEPAGHVDVQLTPLANVAAGVPEVVTFGVPFTRGSVNQAQLSQVRVLKGGVEIPAF